MIFEIFVFAVWICISPESKGIILKVMMMTLYALSTHTSSPPQRIWNQPAVLKEVDIYNIDYLVDGGDRFPGSLAPGDRIIIATFYVQRSVRHHLTSYIQRNF